MTSASDRADPATPRAPLWPIERDAAVLLLDGSSATRPSDEGNSYLHIFATRREADDARQGRRWSQASRGGDADTVLTPSPRRAGGPVSIG